MHTPIITKLNGHRTKLNEMLEDSIPPGAPSHQGFAVRNDNVRGLRMRGLPQPCEASRLASLVYVPPSRLELQLSVNSPQVGFKSQPQFSGCPYEANAHRSSAIPYVFSIWKKEKGLK